MKAILILALPPVLGLLASGNRAAPGGSASGGAGGSIREGGIATCAANVRDRTSGQCIPADSTPTLGALYPLSTDLNVNVGNRVGIGTTFSQAKLHVETTGPLGGIYSVSEDRFGLWGVSTNDHGVEGTTTNGFGVRGFSSNSHGVFGATNGTVGTAGVYGSYSSNTGVTPGVLGSTRSTSSQAVGVQGIVDTTSAGSSSAGVRGINEGTGSFGIGVWGSHDGSGWGVSGSVLGAGVGVRGFAPPTGTAVYASGNLTVTGTKAFAQPHPSDPTKEIRFVCLEGNESGTYFRGTARLSGGRAVIPVPEEFRMASEAHGVTVQVTALGDARLWVEERGLDRVVVRGGKDVDFDYFVNGVRRGFADHAAIQHNTSFVPQVRGEPFGEDLPPAARAILVENGTLRADFTPDERTAARLGWELENLPAQRTR